jgi:hypothetical protein
MRVQKPKMTIVNVSPKTPKQIWDTDGCFISATRTALSLGEQQENYRGPRFWPPCRVACAETDFPTSFDDINLDGRPMTDHEPICVWTTKDFSKELKKEIREGRVSKDSEIIDLEMFLKRNASNVDRFPKEIVEEAERLIKILPTKYRKTSFYGDSIYFEVDEEGYCVSIRSNGELHLTTHGQGMSVEKRIDHVIESLGRAAKSLEIIRDFAKKAWTAAIEHVDTLIAARELPESARIVPYNADEDERPNLAQYMGKTEVEHA